MSEPHSTFVCGRLPAGLARRNLKAFAARLEREVTGGRTFTCLLTNDTALHRLNREFLKRDYPTDVLSFPASDGRRATGDEPLGDLAISLDRAAAQARELGHSLEIEVEILVLHGVLHLLGMDHEKDRGRMARAERRHREELGLPAGLIERVRP